MHFEILVEDQSGKRALEVLIPKIIGSESTFTIQGYGGIGRIPKNLDIGVDASQRTLLNLLPKLLNGYGKTFAAYPNDYPAAVILVCDLDDKCLVAFRQELFRVHNACKQKPETRFCIAIEDGEAWFLGDIPAIKTAFPMARVGVLDAYVPDSICGAWERLADAVYPNGSQGLSRKGWRAIGAEKSLWSASITPHMDVDQNLSPSFCYFRDKIRQLAGVI